MHIPVGTYPRLWVGLLHDSGRGSCKRATVGFMLRRRKRWRCHDTTDACIGRVWHMTGRGVDFQDCFVERRLSNSEDPPRSRLSFVLWVDV
jgi:hypothetical protein